MVLLAGVIRPKTREHLQGAMDPTHRRTELARDAAGRTQPSAVAVLLADFAGRLGPPTTPAPPAPPGMTGRSPRSANAALTAHYTPGAQPPKTAAGSLCTPRTPRSSNASRSQPTPGERWAGTPVFRGTRQTNLASASPVTGPRAWFPTTRQAGRPEPDHEEPRSQDLQDVPKPVLLARRR